MIAVEGEPGLVVHGPLLALLWLKFRAVTAHAVVAEFDYCLMRPVFVGAIVVTPGGIGAQASQLVLTAAARTSPTPSPPGRRNDPRTSARSCLPGYRGASRINRVVKGSVYQRGSTWYYKFRGPHKDTSTGDYPWITKGGFDRVDRPIAAESTGHRPAHSL